MFKKLRLFLLLFLLLFFVLQFVHSKYIVIDSDETTQNFIEETALNLEDNVFNVFLDTQTDSQNLRSVYSSVLSKNNREIEQNCNYVKNLLKGRLLKYLDDKETKEYIISNELYGFSIFVYTLKAEPEVLKAIYEKHPKYVSFITSCRPEEVFENVDDAKSNRYAFKTTPIILSQVIVILMILFFLIIGLSVLINISTPKAFEEKQLIINKEH